MRPDACRSSELTSCLRVSSVQSNLRRLSTHPGRVMMLALTVPLCSRCEGCHEDPVTRRKLRNSIPENHVQEWRAVQASCARASHWGQAMQVRCTNCGFWIAGDEIMNEALLPCNGDMENFKRISAKSMKWVVMLVICRQWKGDRSLSVQRVRGELWSVLVVCRQEKGDWSTSMQRRPSDPMCLFTECW